METDEVYGNIDRLINDWCDRKNIIALKHILSGWPLVSGLTDEWARLLDSLEGVRDYASQTLTSEEKVIVDDLIKDIKKKVYRY
jgi:hypothetical protein